MLTDSFQQKLYSPEGMKLLVIDGRFVDAPDYHPSLCEVVLHKELESLNEELESLELLSVYPSDCIQIGDNAGNPKDVSFVYFPIISMKFRNHSMTSHSSLCGSSRSSEEILLVIDIFFTIKDIILHEFQTAHISTVGQVVLIHFGLMITENCSLMNT